MSTFEAGWVGFILGVLIMGGAALIGSLEQSACDPHTRMKVECNGFYCEPVKRKPLPEICAPFYNDGTGRWAECMGVGPK